MFDTSLKRRAKEAYKRMLRRGFEVGQRFGLDVLPRHFYSAIPDIRELRRSQSWRAPSTMVGVRGVDPAEQTKFLEDVCAPFAGELQSLDVHTRACREASEVGYGEIEADLLYCFIRAKRPRRVVQVGCGVSTAVILGACRDGGLECEVTCVEPYPSPYLKRLGAEGKIKLVPERAQDVALETLHGSLSDGDFLFIDSTHTVKPGSEVNRLILEVLPRLQPGVFVHFHDVYFPFDYQHILLTETLFFWLESTLLHAFLIGNDRWTIRVSMAMLHHAQPDVMRQLLPNFRPATYEQGLLQGLKDGAGQMLHAPNAIYLQHV